MVWDVERLLAEDVVRPVLHRNRGGACRQPCVRGYTPMINRIYDVMRMEEVWLDC